MDLNRRSMLAVAMVIGLLTAPNIVSAQSAPPSGTPPSAAPPSASPPSPEASPGSTGTLPALKAPLAAGHYTSDILGAPLGFDLADDAWKGDQLDGQFLELTRQMGAGSGVLSVMTFDGKVATDPCAPAFDGQIEMTAAAFTDWLTALPALSTTATPTTLFGLPATRLDTTVLATACPDSPFILLWDGFRLYPSEAMRVITTEAGGKIIIVSAETVQSIDLPDFLDAAQPVIDSMSLSPAGSSSPAPPPSA